MYESISWPQGFGRRDLVAYGISGLVVLDRASKTVIKSPHGQDDQASIDLESSIYTRLSAQTSHPGFLEFHGYYQSSPNLRGIRLEFAPNFTVENFLSRRSADVTRELRLRWSRQIPNALSHLHALNIVHGDLTCANIFLATNLDARLGDFAGSSIDGSPLTYVIRANHRYPGPLQSVKADIFAFGSVLYHIWTGRTPYYDLVTGCADEDSDALLKREEEVIARYARREFPKTEFLGDIGGIILRCWQGAFNDAEECAKEIATLV